MAFLTEQITSFYRKLYYNANFLPIVLIVIHFSIKEGHVFTSNIFFHILKNPFCHMGHLLLQLYSSIRHDDNDIIIDIDNTYDTYRYITINYSC